MRKKYSKFFISYFLLFNSIVLNAQDKTIPKPNVVLVFIDDMGWGDFSCFGNIEATTPNIDSMGTHGLRFSQFYVNSPVCSPSRVAISTGQFPQRHKITNYLADHQYNQSRGMVDWLDLSAPMLARILSENGYATGHFGKWHMGGQRDVNTAPRITEYGFDTSLTNFEGMGAKLLPLTEVPQGDEIIQGRIWAGAESLGSPVHWTLRSEITTGFASRAIEFMDSAQVDGKPFYVNVWPDDVHSPYFPSVENWADTQHGKYLSVLEEMDAQFKELFDHINNDENLRNNTIVLICSDNGPDRNGGGTAGEFKGHKGTLYEGGIRSPLIVWAPGLMNGDAVGNVNTSSVFSAIDLAPSILNIAGIPVPEGIEFDGEDLSQTILGNVEASRAKPIFWRRPPDWKNHMGYTGLPDLAVRSGSWKLLCDHGGVKPFLYNLDNDPGEKTNLVSQEPELADSLMKLVFDWNEVMPPDADTPKAIDTTDNIIGKVVYYLPFEKNIEDSSVNKISFHQTVGSNLNYEEGPMGQSLVLNNTVLLSENDVFNMYSTHTLAAWIKTDNKNGNNQVFVHQKNDPDLNAGRVHIEMLSSNTISSFTGGVESERTSRPGGVTEGTWYHVASVFDKENKNKLLYIDGELIDSKTLTSTEQCKSEFVIGAFKNEASAFVNGGIDELVLFKKALNETEINNIMKYGVANISTSINKSPKVALAPKINIVNGNAINELIFEYNSGLASNYSIYDMTGKINHKGVSYSGQSVFLNILDPGTYIVQVEVDSQLASKKVFVE